MSAGKQDRIQNRFKTVGLYFYSSIYLLWRFHIIVTLLKRVKIAILEIGNMKFWNTTFENRYTIHEMFSDSLYQ